MKTEHAKSTLIMGVILLATGAAFAQSFIPIKKHKDIVVTAGLGASIYFGDLRDTYEWRDARLAMRASVQLHPWPTVAGNRFAFRSGLNFFRLYGSDRDAPNSRVVRNLSFYSNNLEWNTSMVLHVLPEGHAVFKKNRINLYGVAGVGLLYTNPKTRYQGKDVALQPLQTEGVRYSPVQVVIPFGIGIKLTQSARYHVALEATWRHTFTDYLDDTSGRFYADPQKLATPLAVALSDRRGEYFQANGIPYDPSSLGKGNIRGNPAFKDSYALITLNVGYTLPYYQKNASKKLMTIRKKKPITK